MKMENFITLNPLKLYYHEKNIVICCLFFCTVAVSNAQFVTFNGRGGTGYPGSTTDSIRIQSGGSVTVLLTVNTDYFKSEQDCRIFLLINLHQRVQAS